MFRLKAVAAAFLLSAFCAPVVAQDGAAAPAMPLMPLTLAGDAERGAVLAQTCVGCHGIAGSFNPSPAYHVPKLGGQNADYLEVALLGYRRNTRGHDTMHAQASSLTDQDIVDVAAYFESFKGEAQRGRTRASAEKIEAGRAKSATCAACHGPEGVSAAPQWPNLAGQHETYLTVALERYKSGVRQDMVMNPLAAQLDDAAIEELAAFYAAQSHLYNTEP